MASYYVDSCIYLNLWKHEEEGLFKKRLWKIAKKFFELAEIKNEVIYYSGYLLKELSYKLTENEFLKKKKIIDSSPNFLMSSLKHEEYEKARIIERKYNFKIGFFDIIHLLLTEKTDSIMITRDKQLLKFAKNLGISAKLPEEIIP